MRLGSGGPWVPGDPMPTGAFRIIHKRTNREWEVETKIYRPSSGLGAVAVRAVGQEGPFLPLEWLDLPEGFRLPIAETLADRIPDLGQALIRSIRELGLPEGGGDSAPNGPEGRRGRKRRRWPKRSPGS